MRISHLKGQGNYAFASWKPVELALSHVRACMGQVELER